MYVAAGPDVLALAIEDRGFGFDPETALNGLSSGLMGMRERTRLVNGRFAVESTRGAGTRVIAELPLT